MIKQPTVFVLGAGASMPYGFPSGAQLSQMVVDDLGGPGSVLWNRLESNGVDVNRMREFSRVFRESSRDSLDVFLQSRREFSAMGRMAIAFLIAGKEKDDALYPETSKDWFKYLLNRMLGTRVEEFQSNRLKVITFNFDRSFERRVFLAVRANYGLRDAEAFDLCQKTVPVLHMHGDLGEPGWGDSVSEWARPYGSLSDAQSRSELRRWGDRIRIIHDDIEESTLQRAHDWLREARNACFIGLSYNSLILERLRISTLARTAGAPSFHGTFWGMERGEIGEAMRAFNGLMSEYQDEAYPFLRKCGVVNG